MRKIYNLANTLIAINIAIIIVPILIAFILPNSVFMAFGFIFPMMGIMALPYTGLFFIITLLILFVSNFKKKKNSNLNSSFPDNEIVIDSSDTSFLFLVNSDLYHSYVKEDWDLEQDLLSHIDEQQQLANILMYQLNSNITLTSWTIHTYVNKKISLKKYLKKSKNYIKVSNNKLYFVDYTCLTIAAQFDDKPIPNNICEPFVIELENGFYEVESFLYNDMENGNRLNKKIDMDVYFTSIPSYNHDINSKINWT